MQHLELSQTTYDHFLKLKKTIEEMAGESVTDDQVVDFLIRSMMSSVELPDEEHGGCGCCCGGHDHDHHDHDHHCCQEKNEKHCGCKEHTGCGCSH